MLRSPRRLLAGVLLVILVGVVALRSVHTRMDTGVITVGQTPSAIAVDAPAGHAFITNFLDNTVTMVDTTTGAVMRTIAVGHVPSAVVVDARTRRAFVLNQKDSSVSILDAATGDVLGTRYVPNSSALAVDEPSGHLFVVGNSNATFTSPGTLAMFDARSGVPLNRTPLGGSMGLILKGLAIDPRAGRGWLTNCLDGTVSMFDTRSGRVVKSRTVGGCPLAVVAGGAGHTFVTNQSDATVRMLDTRSAAVLRAVGVSQAPIALAVNGRTERVFVIDSDMNANNAKVSVLDARTGALRGTINLAPNAPNAPCTFLTAVGVDVDHGRTFVLVGRTAVPGNVSVLDARAVRVLRTVAMDGAPVAMAVDESTRHLFVVNQAMKAPSGDSGAARGQDVWGRLLSWLRQRMPWGHNPARPSTNGNVAVLDLSRL